MKPSRLFALFVAAAAAIMLQPFFLLQTARGEDASVPQVAAGERCTAQTVLPPANLRGYGRLAATQYEFRLFGRPATILAIDCENAEKGKLTLAKYLSDLGVLAGTTEKTLTTARGNLQYREVEEQGVIAAVRGQNRVLLLAADAPAALAALYEQHLSGNAAQWVSRSEAEVPMWLDRWDKYGFRFYYSRPLLTPSGTELKDYDFVKEFEYAAKMDHAGLLFWNHPLKPATAEGLREVEAYDWAL